MIIKTDNNAQTLSVDPCSHIVRVDGVILCKRVVRNGVVILQFKDGDRMRSRTRGTAFIEVPLAAFEAALMAALAAVERHKYS